MKRSTTIFACVLAAGMASAQNPSIIQNTKAIMQGVQANETRATNQALGISSGSQASASTSMAKPAASVSSGSKSSPAKPSVAIAKAPVKVAPAIAVKPAPKATAAKEVAKSAPKAVTPKTVTPKAATKAAVVAPAAAKAGAPSAPEAAKAPEKPESKWSMTGKRDPFISPVVYQTGPSNCASGKKCLEIGAISLKGVVHSDNGFIAVVTNNLNKAYFLRENDPVFDGYVVKITGDSIIFQETTQDKLGKTFTKEVVKKLTTPSV